ncbi:acyl-CoA dehydrogenase family protein [Parendozoicomonas haliclonae]|uniref:Acyl-CoA dehydrogenase n=1 Tax=Parendozoicomonas haliclonae TaxID=1960125 RepID=A0A1X7ADI1_9GAMM|nr:acyl-CoA dehydrogenase family protein [Parendozoicomonas haliclonae]SMA31901.1 Acyl-CoA dehydrogenase [Parendozoicomonas haliclonae]
MLSQHYFNDEHALLRESVRRFVEQNVLPHIDEWESAQEFPVELYKQLGDAGFLGIGFPEELGGCGGDVFHKVVFTEEIMRAGSGGLSAGIGSHDIGLPPIVRLGSAELKERVVPPVLRGEKIAALAITEPGGGSDVANLKTRAVREGDTYRINGSKTFITSGCRADYYTVGVRTGGEGFGGISLIMVEKGTPGFSVGKKLKKMGWRCSDTAELFFEDCVVPVSNLIGAENQGFAAIMGNFQNERLLLALMANMTSRLALEQATAYVRQREAFGRSISKFQVTRHKLADLATLLQASDALTYQVADAMNQGRSVIKEVSMAKNFATDCSDKITHQAVQLFGGMGFMEECLVERLYRDNRILSLGGGTREIMNEIISKQMGL